MIEQPICLLCNDEGEYTNLSGDQDKCKHEFPSNYVIDGYQVNGKTVTKT